jgi:hypothetical protein
MKLLDLYRSILDAAKLVTTEDGFVSMKLADESKPALVKGKRLVLPTREHLSNPDWKNRVAFHPLAENVLRAESEVLGFLRQAFNIRANYTFGLVAYQLLTIATSPAEHAKLSPDQVEFLSKLKNADEKTLQVLQKLMQAYPATSSFVSIYLKRTGQVAGRRYARVGVVSFPMYKDLKSNAPEVNGVKMRVKDREALIALLEYMVPTIDEADENNRGSDSQLAPFLDALMKAVLVVAGPLNAVIELFRNQLEDPDELLFNDEWVETFDNLGVMKDEIRMIPMQAGNEGAVSKTEELPPGPAAAPAPFSAPAAPAAPAATGPQPGSLAHHFYGSPPPVQAQPTYVAPGYPGGPAPYGAPSGFPATHGAPAPAAPVHTGRGVDFNSLLATNPALAATVGAVGMQPGMMMGGMPQQQRQPSWAAPQPGMYQPMQPMGYQPMGYQPQYQPGYQPGL